MAIKIQCAGLFLALIYYSQSNILREN